jgi:hypothetical protein
MRRLPWWLAAVLASSSCGPARRGPTTATPGGGSDAAAAEAAPGTVPAGLLGPTNSDQAAAQLIAVEPNPGQAAIVLHCSFGDGWAAAVPQDVADETGDYLVQAVVALGSFQEVMSRIPDRGRLAAYAARSCSPDLVLQLPPGRYQLVVGRRNLLVAPLAQHAGWMDSVEVAAGDRLELYISADDATLDVPCIE